VATGGTGEKLKNLKEKVKNINLDKKKIGFLFGEMSRIM